MITNDDSDIRNHSKKYIMTFREWLNYKINIDEIIIANEHIPFKAPLGKITKNELHYLPLGVNIRFNGLSKKDKNYFVNNNIKNKLIWINFNKTTDFHRRCNNNINRYSIHEMLEKKRKYHFCDLFSDDTNEYYKIIGNYKFVVSPEGEGIDTFRHYDSFYSKAIPIIESNIEMKAKLEGLPVLWTKDYSELDKDYLETKYNSFLDSEFNFNKLFKSYYSTIEQKIMDFNFSYWNYNNSKIK